MRPSVARKWSAHSNSRDVWPGTWVLCGARTLHIMTSRRARTRSSGFCLEESRLSELNFRDGVMDRIRLRERRYDERAYLFVLAGLEYCQQHLPERRHITGQE